MHPSGPTLPFRPCSSRFLSEGGFDSASQLRLGDEFLHERGQRISSPLCQVTVPGDEEGCRPTVVLLAPELVGDFWEQSRRHLATLVFFAQCSPTRELQRLKTLRKRAPYK